MAGHDTKCYVLCMPQHMVPRFALVPLSSEELEAQGGWGLCPSSRRGMSGCVLACALWSLPWAALSTRPYRFVCIWAQGICCIWATGKLCACHSAGIVNSDEKTFMLPALVKFTVWCGYSNKIKLHVMEKDWYNVVMPKISDHSVLYQLRSGLRLGDRMDCPKVSVVRPVCCVLLLTQQLFLCTVLGTAAGPPASPQPSAPAGSHWRTPMLIHNSPMCLMKRNCLCFS